jgi:hypothetical protein
MVRHWSIQKCHWNRMEGNDRGNLLSNGCQRWYYYIMRDAHPIRNDGGEACDFAGSHSGASPESRKGTIVFTNKNIDCNDWSEDSTRVCKSSKSIGSRRDLYHWNANICPEPWQVDLLLGDRINYRKQHPCESHVLEQHLSSCQKSRRDDSAGVTFLAKYAILF